MPTLYTSVIVDLLRGHDRSLRAVERHVAAAKPLFVAPHTLFELYRGAFARASPAAEVERIEAVRAGLVVLPFDERAAREAALIVEELGAAGTPIPERDVFIAASTMVWGDRVILTHDLEPFRRMETFGLVAQRP